MLTDFLDTYQLLKSHIKFLKKYVFIFMCMHITHVVYV